MSTIYSIALPVPLFKTFDYLSKEANLQAGQRVLVSFGRRKLVGMVWERKAQSDLPQSKLKTIESQLDTEIVMDDRLRSYCQWLSQYYHHPLGEVCFTMLPNLLRKTTAASLQTETCYQLTSQGLEAVEINFKRAPKQWQTLQQLQRFKDQLITVEQLKTIEIEREHLRPLIKKMLLKTVQQAATPRKETDHLEQAPTLNQQQNVAVTAINQTQGSFAPFLLEGITGSGKTEVYLQAIDKVIAAKQQALVLVPEISLTPQTISRFTRRFGNRCVALHSGLSDRERLNAWLNAKAGQVDIVIGTRSAIFTPFERLGIIIIDEEHDLSFKQQEGLRYSARDFAILRAQREQLPIVLGSATPSLESLHNAIENKYHHLKLTQRAREATLPHYLTADYTQASSQHGLTPLLIQKMQQHLEQNKQVLLFLNRRGFSPVLMCHECGWIDRCERCQINFTYHQNKRRLICHHCDSQHPIPSYCPDCTSEQLIPVGVGTERIEEVLPELFPNTEIIRVDRDSTRKKGELHRLLDKIHEGGAKILIGTQMLAKGHHFPEVTLVGILNCDYGFFSSDFRAIERTGQLITQVAGRAGRDNVQGEVVIQTAQPNNPLLIILLKEGYHAFAEQLLEERSVCGLPPYHFFALLRAEANRNDHAQQFLQSIKQLCQPHAQSAVAVLGPCEAPMAKRAGLFRQQLLLKAHSRKQMNHLLQRLTFHASESKLARQVRWSIDVDPQEFY